MSDAEKQKVLYGAIVLGILALGVLAGGTLHWWSTSQGAAPQLSSSFVIIAVVALIVALVLIAAIQWSAKADEASKSAGSSWEQKILMFLVLLGVLVVGCTFIWVGVGVNLKDAGPELKLPLVVIIGVVVLLVTLALVAVTFSILNMQNREQPLALPEGSVRAVIALMLLLVFAIAAIFLYSNVASSGKVDSVKDLNFQSLQQWKKHVTVVQTIPPEPATEPARGQPNSFTLFYRNPGSQAADDLAKQLVVLLGTLVTAVASFYFGSSSVASARDAADRAQRGVAGPNATKVTPTTLNPDGTSQSLSITGTNLGKIVGVKLTLPGRPPIVASPATVKASEAEVTCSVTVPKSTQYGTWSVVLSDASDNDSTVKNSVTITGPKPSATSVETGRLNKGQEKQPFKVTGTDLANVETVQLVLTGQPPIVADKDSVKASDKEVTCTMTIQPGTAAGLWDVTVSDTAKTESTIEKKVHIG